MATLREGESTLDLAAPPRSGTRPSRATSPRRPPYRLMAAELRRWDVSSSRIRRWPQTRHPPLAAAVLLSSQGRQHRTRRFQTRSFPTTRAAPAPALLLRGRVITTSTTTAPVVSWPP